MSTYGIVILSLFSLLTLVLILLHAKAQRSLFHGTHTMSEMNEKYIRKKIIRDGTAKKADEIMHKTYDEIMNNHIRGKKAKILYIAAYRESLSLVSQYFDADERHELDNLEDFYLGYECMLRRFYGDSVFGLYNKIHQFEIYD